MLNDGDFGKLTKEQNQSIKLALDGSNRMARLIDDLLNISRMQAGKFYIDPTKVNLAKMVEEEVLSLQTLAKTKKVFLTCVLHKEKIPEMNLDDNKTRQVIMNLVDNAINYSASTRGGGKVSVHLARQGAHIVFKVVDNGIGVPINQRAHLFTKMFRA
ncbi:MAG: HAMP domain-containing sensor histidine kinase, partial [Patescibacteria group bacterium]|nr:HAMP domain-containing sensor histidine kinase [Patescibacteria group bacterium]